MESTVLSTLGGLVGLAVGTGLAWLLKTLVSGLPVSTPWNYVLGALGLSVLIGLGCRSYSSHACSPAGSSRGATK